jgi:hypothetical protein
MNAIVPIQFESSEKPRGKSMKGPADFDMEFHGRNHRLWEPKG